MFTVLGISKVLQYCNTTSFHPMTLLLVSVPSLGLQVWWRSC
jgi:hypothetical protein